VLHLVYAALVLGMVSAGFWQLRRLDERRDHNRLLEERAAAATIDVAAELDPTAGAADVEALEWRTAEARGRYVLEDEVLVRSRSFDGAPGAWVLTPLRTAAGTALVVNRGWVPASGPPTLPPGAAAPTGEVVVRGLLVGGEQRGRFGPTDPADGRLPTLARADLDRLQQQVGDDLYPLYLRLEQQAPAPGGFPVPLPQPERDEGPHLSYAGQWFLFTAVALVGYPLLLRRSARQRGERAPDAGSAAGPARETASGG
jgi:cytochrome oxidase assembly protein ShyY1